MSHKAELWARYFFSNTPSAFFPYGRIILFVMPMPLCSLLCQQMLLCLLANVALFVGMGVGRICKVAASHAEDAGSSLVEAAPIYMYCSQVALRGYCSEKGGG